jgi:flagellar biosynthesis protein FlhF
MNVKRFTARSPREALQLVRQAFGDDAVVLSTRPCPEGVEMLAMPHDGVRQIESFASGLPASQPGAPAPAPGLSGAARPPQPFQPLQPQPQAQPQTGPDADADTSGMSTLSFQEYVRERMLKRRQAEMARPAVPALPPMAGATAAPGGAGLIPAQPAAPAQPMPVQPLQAAPAQELPVLNESIQAPPPDAGEPAEPVAQQAVAPVVADLRREQVEMLNELRSARAMIEQRLDALAYADQLQRNPAQAALSQRLLDCGFSPALIRKLGSGLPQDVADPLAWAASVLQRNLCGAEGEVPLEEECGVYALIGSTGVGKTTTTAKLAAACATRHGPGQLGLVTLDAYRVGAHEQLRTYGRILGVPVHTAHDRASLEDLLSLLGGKKMVIIDTAGMAQRDERTRELLEMLVHPSIRRLLVVNAASQGETIDDVMRAWRAAQCRGVILSKLDEAVKLAPALDAVIRHRLRVVGVATGQRVPEDWHRLSAQALVERALRPTGAAVYRLQADDVSLVLSGVGRTGPGPASAVA